MYNYELISTENNVNSYSISMSENKILVNISADGEIISVEHINKKEVSNKNVKNVEFG